MPQTSSTSWRQLPAGDHPSTPLLPAPPESVSAHNRVVKRLGEHWTVASRFDVSASNGVVVLDLPLPHLTSGDLEIRLDADHSTITLLMEDGAVIDDAELRCVGRCRIKDWSGLPALDGRRIRLVGRLRHSEIRVRRGGIAIAALVLYRMRRDVRRVHDQGRLGAPSSGTAEARVGKPDTNEKSQ
jgi:hypothetical protein